jgi:hypothetical protein
MRHHTLGSLLVPTEQIVAEIFADPTVQARIATEKAEAKSALTLALAATAAATIVGTTVGVWLITRKLEGNQMRHISTLSAVPEAPKAEDPQAQAPTTPTLAGPPNPFSRRAKNVVGSATGRNVISSLGAPAGDTPYYYTPAYQLVATASMAASAFHGYKRNESVGWALWWGLMGGMFPVITPVIAVAQGFAKRGPK